MTNFKTISAFSTSEDSLLNILALHWGGFNVTLFRCENNNSNLTGFKVKEDEKSVFGLFYKKFKTQNKRWESENVTGTRRKRLISFSEPIDFCMHFFKVEIRRAKNYPSRN